MNTIRGSGRAFLQAALACTVLWLMSPACERSRNPVDGLQLSAHSRFNLGDTVTLAYREIAENAPSRTTLRFDSILEDSRCPIDVLCVWEGNARISFVLEEPGGRHRFALNTHAGFTRDTAVAGRRIAMLDVLPAPPGHERRLSPEEYRAVVTVR